jgi:hypothetical protein
MEVIEMLFEAGPVAKALSGIGTEPATLIRRMACVF